MQLTDSELMAWRLFEESNDAILLVDAETEAILQVNPVAQKLTGLSWRILRTRQLDDLICSERPGRMRSLLSALRESGYFHSRDEYRLRMADGQTTPINVTVSRVHAPSGEVGLVVVREIADRKFADGAVEEFNDEVRKQVRLQTEQLQAANAALADEIAKRKRDERALQEMNRKLQEAIGQQDLAQQDALRRERLRAIEQITDGVANDIDHSVALIAKFADALLGRDLDEQAGAWARGIQTAGREVAGTVQRLRQSYGKPLDEEARQRIDLKRLAEEVVERTVPHRRDVAMLEARSISVSVHGGDASTVFGDPAALRSVLTNLVLNAIDAIDERPGEVRIQVEDGEPGWVSLEVRDDGHGMGGRGMGGEGQYRCTEPFYTTKPEGAGLGLSVCHGVLKSHGGWLKVESEPGRGTTARIVLPAADADQATSAGDGRDVEDAVVDFSGIRVLYIDDNSAAQRSTAALLESMGLVVNTAGDGVEGLAKFAEDTYDLVITDKSMPVMDGLQVTTEIKRRCSAMPVVMISGLSSDALPAAGGSQPDRWLTKPISFEDLSDTLAQLTRRGS